MDLVFREEAGHLHGWIVSRVNGDDLPLIKTVSFDGETLRLQMKAPPDKSHAEMPSLVIRTSGKKLKGNWIRDGKPVGPGLKLVRRTSQNV